MCAAPNNFNSNLSMIQPTVPPQQNIQSQSLQQFGSYPVPPYPLYPGIPYPSLPPGYPAIPIPIPLQQFPQNNNSNSNDNDSDDRRNSSKRSHDSKDRHGNHRRSRGSNDDYRDHKRGRDRDRDRHQDGITKRPIHTVFFYNIPFEVKYDEFRDFATKFGEISNIYPIFKKGIAFVTYNDIRDAQKAVYSQDAYLLDRKVKRDFASKPPDHARKNPCDTCSTVLVSSLEDVSKIKADDVIDKMRDFGEIRSTSQDRPRSGEFVIKFFKLSDAKNCVAHNGLDLRHETLKIEYLPEEDAGEEPDNAKGKRGDNKHKNDTDYDNSGDDSDDSGDDSKGQKQQQQQLQQQQMFQMHMLQQFHQMQQQLQQFQQIQGQYQPQPIPPPPPLQAQTTTTPTPIAQPPQAPGFPSFGF